MWNNEFKWSNCIIWTYHFVLPKFYNLVLTLGVNLHKSKLKIKSNYEIWELNNFVYCRNKQL